MTQLRPQIHGYPRGGPATRHRLDRVLRPRTALNSVTMSPTERVPLQRRLALKALSLWRR